jgi:hypothetical protein
MERIEKLGAEENPNRRHQRNQTAGEEAARRNVGIDFRQVKNGRGKSTHRQAVAMMHHDPNGKKRAVPGMAK